MLDVHVLIGMAKPVWRRECLRSVYHAAGFAQFDVSVHLVTAIPGDIGIGRAKGYAMGFHPYVTCVDDDDFVLPNAFSQMASHIGSGMALLTPEWLDYNGRRIKGKSGHHLTVFPRDRLIDHERWAACGDIVQNAMVRDGAVELPEAAYVHRIYPDSPARVLRRSHPSELHRASHG